MPQFYKKTKHCLLDIRNYLRKIHFVGRELILVGGGGKIWWGENLMWGIQYGGGNWQISGYLGIPPSRENSDLCDKK